MKQIRIYRYVVFLVFVALIILACGGGMAAATATLFPSASPTVANTATPNPTNTPNSTATEIPPTITPAPIGVSVTYDSLEITVLGVKNLESVHFGEVSGNWETFYKPLAGKYLIDIGVLVRNLDPDHAVLMNWRNVYIVESNGNAWYPAWGSMRTVNVDKKMDPFTIGLSSTPIDGEAAIEFNDTTYMRLIFSVEADPEQEIRFAIEDSPIISFRVTQ